MKIELRLGCGGLECGRDFADRYVLLARKKPIVSCSIVYIDALVVRYSIIYNKPLVG